MELTRLLAPRSVAVVGATDRPGSYAGATIENLLAAGFDGRVVGVHPTRREVLGIACVPRLPDAGPVDAVVIATPADTVAGLVRAARDLGCGGAVVYASGFAEAGDRAAQDALVEAAGEFPVVGPNGNGLVSVARRAPLWGDAVTLPAGPGPIALVTQSGNVGVIALAHRGGVGLHTVVSIGNAAVVSAADVVAELAVTEGVRAVALYLEADGDGAAWAGAFAACAENDVRLAVLKAGRSPRGAAMGAAHTDALLGDQRAFASLVREAGGAMVRDPHELLETARALALGRRDSRGAAVLTSSGGDAAMAADIAHDLGALLATLGPATAEALAPVLPPGVAATNPLDHTNHVWADTAGIAAITEVVAHDPEVGHVIYCQDQPPGLPAHSADEWQATREGGLVGAARGGQDAMLVCTTPGQEPAPSAISGLVPLMTAVATLQRPAPSGHRLRAMAAACRGSAADGPSVPEHAAKAMLAGRGVSVPEARLAATVDDAVAAARDLGAPVALKLSAPGLLHKAQVGALELGVVGDDGARTAATRLLALPEAVGDGALLVERMVGPGPEVIVAVSRAGVVPVLMIGLGGAWAEALDDVAITPLPLDPDSVRVAIGSLRGHRLIDTHPALGDLIRVAHAAADLLLEGRWSLVELNPVILTGTGAIAVDAVVR